MDKTLLIGNGINRAEECGPSWDSLIEEIRPPSLRLATDEGEEQIPQPIQFEMIGSYEGLRLGRRRGDSYSGLKKKIASKLEDATFRPGELHRMVFDTDAANIITTNYDYCLEKASGDWDGSKATKWNSQQKYLLGSTGTAKGVRFFHAHGIQNVPSSICIGYEHYMGYIQHIRDALVKSKAGESGVEEPLVFRILRGEGVFDGAQWPLLLFSTDVAIVGLGLSFSEVDLWWLLTLRSALFSGSGQRGEIRNNITYYDITQIDEDERDREKRMANSAKAIALDGLHVNYRPIARRSYREGYAEVLRGLRDESSW